MFSIKAIQIIPTKSLLISSPWKHSFLVINVYKLEESILNHFYFFLLKIFYIIQLRPSILHLRNPILWRMPLIWMTILFFLMVIKSEEKISDVWEYKFPLYIAILLIEFKTSWMHLKVLFKLVLYLLWIHWDIQLPKCPNKIPIYIGTVFFVELVNLVINLIYFQKCQLILAVSIV